MKDLVRPPVELFEFEGMSDFLEWSLLRSWMEQWLNYLKWYCSVSVDPMVTLDQLLDAPVVTYHWNIRRTDENLVRWGLLWQCYNLVQERGLAYMGNVLGPGCYLIFIAYPHDQEDHLTTIVPCSCFRSHNLEQ